MSWWRGVEEGGGGGFNVLNCVHEMDQDCFILKHSRLSPANTVAQCAPLPRLPSFFPSLPPYDEYRRIGC